MDTGFINATAALDALVCGYSVSNRRRKAIMVLQAYADESEGEIVSLTACILPYPDWATFAEHWAAALSQSPAIAYFHMREARSLQGQFSGWDTLRRDLKLVRLASVIAGHKPHTMTAWMRKSAFDSILKPNSVFENAHCYFPLFHFLIFFSAEYNRRRNVQLPTDFIFDDKGAIGNAALDWYDWVLSAARDELKPYFGAKPIFRDDLNVLPLQAVDLVAWNVHRKLEVHGQDIERVATAQLDDLPGHTLELNKHVLEQISAEFQDVFNTNYPVAELMRIKPDRRRKLIAKLKKRVKKIVESEASEFEKFDKTMRTLMTVSHDAIKAKLDAEKAAKKRKAKPSSSGRASSAED